METREIFKNLSPLDHRYARSDPGTYESLSRYLSEDAGIRYCVRVEAALLEAHLELLGTVDPTDLAQIRALPDRVSPEDVYAEEEKTRHNIRALVNVMKSALPAHLRQYVHTGATSVDVLDTAAALRYREVAHDVVIPSVLRLLENLVKIVENEADTPQLGRTHGQHAVPITFGFAIAEYVARIGKSVVRILDCAEGVRGKLAGAVGAYNALSLVVADPEGFERRVLTKLGLEPSEHSTQLVEPEYLLRLFLELATCFGVVANLADDIRNLQRSEIAEIQEMFGESQVGSSTMPQKRNPWNSEHVKSLWKAYAPRVMTFFMDQISEHQRDLTNSASGRFAAEFVAGFTFAVERMNSVVDRLHVDRERMLRNIESAGPSLVAEAVYILLAKAGESDGHEIVRVATREAETTGRPLVECLKAHGAWDAANAECEKTFGVGLEHVLHEPERYSGRAAAVARRVAATHRETIARISMRIEDRRVR